MAMAGILPTLSADLGRPSLARRENASREEIDMTKLWAIIAILASFVLVAPVVESGTSNSLLFVAVGNADGGGGGE
jgi:hypothetical protein